MLEDRPTQIEEIDVTITGHSSKQLIICHRTSKRRMSCSTEDLLNELSAEFLCKRKLIVDNDVITGYEK